MNNKQNPYRSKLISAIINSNNQNYRYLKIKNKDRTMKNRYNFNNNKPNIEVLKKTFYLINNNLMI